MTKKYNILVIEDTPKHLVDVKELMDKRSDLIDTVYASNLYSALEVLASKEWDGILSDALFPEQEGGVELPSWIKIIEYAMGKRIPFTIVTSRYHHSTGVEPVSQRSRNSGMELIDNLGGLNESIKRWPDGLATLVYLIDAQNDGTLRYGVVRDGGADGKTMGMTNINGDGIKFSLPPFDEHALDEIRKKLRL